MTKEALDDLLTEMLWANLSGDYTRLKELDKNYESLCDKVFPKTERGDSSIYPKYDRIRRALVDEREQRQESWKATLGPYDQRPNVGLTSIDVNGEVKRGLVSTVYETEDEESKPTEAEKKEEVKMTFWQTVGFNLFLYNPKPAEPEKKPEKKELAREMLYEDATGFEFFEKDGKHFIRIK